VSYLYEDRQPVEQLSSIWRGVIASSPVDFADRVSIRIPDMTDELVFPDLRWMARNSTELPAPGDSCLILFDNDREPWVIAWWPFDNPGA
jgi:hypothetical protein